jgi:opacity protein-like surface antigen
MSGRLTANSLIALSLAVFALGGAREASAGEITVFVSSTRPRADWHYGEGAALTMGVLKVVLLDVEAARQSGQASETRMTYFTGGAGLKLPMTRVTPYIGVGAGIYHQSQGDNWKLGTLSAFFAGAKLRLADLVVLRAEYRHLNLGGQPYLTPDYRLSLGAGIAF